jgi:hypothetical protein
MTLKEVCQKYALPYRRCHYALITGKVRGVRLRGRCWDVPEEAVPRLQAYLLNNQVNLVDATKGATCPSTRA